VRHAEEQPQRRPARDLRVFDDPGQRIPDLFRSPGVAHRLLVAVLEAVPQVLPAGRRAGKRQVDPFQLDLAIPLEERLDEHMPLIGDDVAIPVPHAIQQAQAE